MALMLAGTAACGGEDSDPPAWKSRKGDPGIHQRIMESKDCAAAQREFDTTNANHRKDLDAGKLELAQIDTDYIATALDRGKELSCPGF